MKKNLICSLILLFILFSCSEKEAPQIQQDTDIASQTEDKAEITNESAEQDKSLTLTFPNSRVGNGYGNNRRSGSIVYNPTEQIYYFFQRNKWSYDTDPVWGTKTSGKPAASDVLAKVNVVNRSLENREVISDFRAEKLAYGSDGEVFCLSEGIVEIFDGRT
ncbi:MAG: hypothetical protein LBS21_04295 [Clostridiales bacterium]|jgi:hypothetical protein|nr:hypothetical protein [Clostridiales bacterium]